MENDVNYSASAVEEVTFETGTVDDATADMHTGAEETTRDSTGGLMGFQHEWFHLTYGYVTRSFISWGDLSYTVNGQIAILPCKVIHFLPKNREILIPILQK